MTMNHGFLRVATALLLSLSGVAGHGYMQSPRSRNFVAFEDGKYSPLLAEDPQKEDCPHCLNLGGTLARCGLTADRNYDRPLNALGDPMHANPQVVYQEGQEITIDVVLTAHHKGHFVYKACTIQEGEVASQECFDANPLEFVKDNLYGAPKDDNHVERAYIAPKSQPNAVTDNLGVGGMKFSHVFKLPAGLTGDLVLIQWHYLTANSCVHEGYDSYPFPDHSWAALNTGSCEPIPEDGNGVPEQFWNCAEVTIEQSGPPTPTPPPTVGPTPVPTLPTPPVPTPPPVLGGTEDSRLIAYLGNWQSCPTAAQVEKYTHIVIAFAVSYQWNPTKNQCSTTCEISTPPICNNAPNAALVQEWQAAGKKVILSFGGAGMGGSWDGDNNDCWEYCYGRETQVINQLTSIVNQLGLDGVDIDYEYFYEDNQNNSGFTKGAEAQKFLTDITTGLRQSLPAGSIVTHAPMEPDVVPGSAYYDILINTASSLDFLMPQYYNGYTRPAVDGIDKTGAGSQSALAHYTNVVDNMFGGDATKMVFGFCISDCSGTGSNANANQAATVMTDLATHYSCNGGSFFWVAQHDTNGAWSSTVSAAMQPNAGCSGGPTPPRPTPTPPPTPEATPLPTHNGTGSTPPPTVGTTPTPTPGTTSPGNMCCELGETKLKSIDSCTKFYHCENGSVVGSPISCSDGLLFDEANQYCNHAYLVTCGSEECSPSTGPPPAPAVARCGATWQDAEASCGAICNTNVDCPSGEYCYAGIKCFQRRLLRGKA